MAGSLSQGQPQVSTGTSAEDEVLCDVPQGAVQSHRCPRREEHPKGQGCALGRGATSGDCSTGHRTGRK